MIPTLCSSSLKVTQSGTPPPSPASYKSSLIFDDPELKRLVFCENPLASITKDSLLVAPVISKPLLEE